jgi:xylulokinase
MSTAGASVKWLCEEILDCTPARMTEGAARAEAGAGGLLFLPYLQGERTPWWDPAAKGAFAGITLHADRNALCRAVLEGVAFGWRQIISLLEEEYGFSAAEVTAVGGGSTNPLWNSIKASVLNKPVRVLEFPETTCLGAAIIGGLGTGVLPDAETAGDVTGSLRKAKAFEPVPDWIPAYEAGFHRYTRLYPALKTVC